MLHQIGLFFHMASIIIVAGASIGMILAEAQLWKALPDHPGKANAFMPILMYAPNWIRGGVLLFLASGLLLLYSVNWVFISQPWFIAKFILFLSLPIRGAVIGSRAVDRVGKLLKEDPTNKEALMALKAKMRRFHIIQFSIVAVIIILVLFKIG